MKKVFLTLMICGAYLIGSASNAPTAKKVAESDNYLETFYELTANAVEITYISNPEQLNEMKEYLNSESDFSFGNVFQDEKGAHFLLLTTSERTLMRMDLEPCELWSCVCPLPSGASKKYTAGEAFIWPATGDCQCIGGCAVWGEE